MDPEKKNFDVIPIDSDEGKQLTQLYNLAKEIRAPFLENKQSLARS